jgi:tetratricopeptide (TPR) repeat protein
MNEVNPEALDSGIVESVGMAVINSVRLLSLKPLLELRENQATLTRIKYAFFMERNRRYDVAIERYKELAARLGDQGEMAGFVALHQGFCLAIVGRTAEALDQLEATRDGYPGTHYAETAILLINILLEGERRREDIEQEGLSDLDRARALFREALYSEALRIFQDIGEQKLAPIDRYRLNRSLEETGRIKGAIRGYIAIVNARRDATAVRESNRRLLLLGTFNGAGTRVREYAESNAAELGDDTALEQIQEAAEEMRAAVVIEEIKNASGADQDPGMRELAKQLEENIVLDVSLQQMARPLIPAAGSAPKVAADYRPPDLQALYLEPPSRPPIDESGRLIVEFRDGRRIRARALNLRGNQVEIEGDFSARVPVTVVRKVGVFERTGADRIALRINGGERETAVRIEFLANEAVLLIYGSDAQPRRIPFARVERLESP